VEERLVLAGRPAFSLDGDNLRHGLNGDLGFDEQARRENVRRTAHVARLLAESGVIVLVSLVSPYARDRKAAYDLHRDDNLPFIEIHVDTPLEICQQRDPKGLYERARRGTIRGLTGLDAPYEPPTRPDLVIRAGQQTVDEAVHQVISALLPS
jgi:bifunctional enzyme CysN/CysC